MDCLGYCSIVYSGIHLTLAIILFCFKKFLLYTEKWLSYFAFALFVVAVQMFLIAWKPMAEEPMAAWNVKIQFLCSILNNVFFYLCARNLLNTASFLNMLDKIFLGISLSLILCNFAPDKWIPHFLVEWNIADFLMTAISILYLAHAISQNLQKYRSLPQIVLSEF